MVVNDFGAIWASFGWFAVMYPTSVLIIVVGSVISIPNAIPISDIYFIGKRYDAICSPIEHYLF